MTHEQQLISKRNRNKAAKALHTEGTGLVLHHINPDWKENDIERYIQWNVDNLVVMTRAEHNALHWQLDYDSRHENIIKNHFTGKLETTWTLSEETKHKQGIAAKKHNTGRHWFNNGIENKFCYECPTGFVSGKLKEREK